MTIRTLRRRARQGGMGIVETMVGILIGMIVVLAVYNVFAVAEGYKRTAVGVADAQTTGLVAQFMLAREIGNAGNGLAVDAADLAKCVTNEPDWKDANPPFFATPARPIRPVPVLIQDGGGANLSDRLIVTYSTPSRVVHSVLMVDQDVLAAGDTIYVQSPNGFRVGDRIIVFDNGSQPPPPNPPQPKCELTRVTAVNLGDSTGNATVGIVGLTTDGAYPLTPPYLVGGVDRSHVINLGPDGTNGTSVSTHTLFDVVNGQLRSTDLFANVPTAVPIAQNIVLLKVQYGVDCGAAAGPPAVPGTITWTRADATGVCGRNYTPDDLIPAAGTVGAQGMNAKDYARWLAAIRAVRIAIVVRSDEPDLKDPSLVGQTATLFDCSTHDAACGPSIAIDKTVLADGWRHRTYETIIPMRNAIYNNGQ